MNGNIVNIQLDEALFQFLKPNSDKSENDKEKSENDMDMSENIKVLRRKKVWRGSSQVFTKFTLKKLTNDNIPSHVLESVFLAACESGLLEIVRWMLMNKRIKPNCRKQGM